MKKLPKEILVRWDGVGPNQFLVVDQTVEEAIGDEQGVVTIGTYRLVATRRMKTALAPRRG